jgi:hypothetical protein
MTDTLKITLDAAKRIAADAEELQVKELAAALDVSTRYVYEMRRLGFSMHGKNNYQQTATIVEARQWIEANHFRMVKCVGIIGAGSKSSIGGSKS